MFAAGLARRTARTVVTPNVFLEVLAKVRQEGYAISVEENQNGLSSVGAPVFGRDGTCIAAVSLVAAAMTLRAEQQARYVRLVRRCAVEISEAMGFGVRIKRGPVT